jgi:hypothetical protein
MFGLEPFKAFASTPMTIVIITMIPQMNMNAFVQFQIVEPKNRLIIFSIFTNDSNIEIVSKKKKIWELAFESQLLRTLEEEIATAASCD